MAETGKVFLVGAGPGDPGLLTIKGKEALEQAEVVVYDRLVSEHILELVPESCERIYVGKTPDHHTLKQDQINALLVEKAQAGKTVVRLKGGDPFVFGRGGEEALELRAHDIEFTIVPGVTSAIAGPAYAGIPVTHRNVASQFSVITGHEDPAKLASSLDWDALARQQGTLVFLMGMHNLPVIVENLVSHGKDADTPVGIIERATLELQRVLRATLSTVVDEVERQGFTNPSIIVIGDVVSLADKLAWMPNTSLVGKCIVVTRARSQASAFASELLALGATVEEYPMIAIEPPENPAPLELAIQSLGSYAWTTFSSVNGVEAFFAACERLNMKNAAAFLSGKTIAAGSSTARRLEDFGVTDVILPKRFTSEGVVDELRERMSAGERVLIVQAQEARHVITEGVVALGGKAVPVAAYRNVAVTDGRNSLVESLKAGRVDAVTFTSSSTVRNFVALLGDDISLLSNVALYSIGPITSRTMESCGLTVRAEAKPSTIESLTRLIQFDLGGTK